MKLCMITYCYITRKGDNKYLDDKFGHLVDQIAPQVDSVDFLASDTRLDDNRYYPEGRSLYTYFVHSTNANIFTVPPSDTGWGPIKKFSVLLKRFVPYFKHISLSDFVYITMPGYSGILASFICRVLNRPYCLYFGSDWQEIASFQADWNTKIFTRLLFCLYVNLSKWSEKSAVRHAQFTIVHGQKLLEKFGSVDLPVVETIPMIAITRQHFFERYDTCKSKSINILYVGSLILRKGVHSLAEAFSFLVNDYHSLYLQIVGSGEPNYIKRLKEQIKSLGLEERINLVGQVNDLNRLLDFYRQADIFVLPSRGEGFPRVIYEAMSQGLPVIASDIGTISSTLEDGREALLVDGENSVDLAKAIRKLISNGELRRHLIRNGYTFARAKIGTRDASEQLLKLINEYASRE